MILRLLLEDRFPRIWVPSWENRDLRQLLWHRHRMVQARTRIMNQQVAFLFPVALTASPELNVMNPNEASAPAEPPLAGFAADA